MKKFKLVLWLVIVAFLGLFFYQNKAYFMARHSLVFHLPLTETYHLPELPNAILFLSFLLLGLLMAYFFSLLERYKSNKTIKGLNATVDANRSTISSLQKEVETYKGGGPGTDSRPDAVPSDSVTEESEPRA